MKNERTATIHSIFRIVEHVANLGYDFDLEQDGSEMGAEIFIAHDQHLRKVFIYIAECPNGTIDVGAWLREQTDDGSKCYCVKGFWNRSIVSKNCTFENVFETVEEALKKAKEIDWKRARTDRYYMYV